VDLLDSPGQQPIRDVMIKDQSGRDTTRRETPPAGEGGSTVGRLAASPVLWGCLATGGFYLAIPHSPVAADLLERYFCGHPLEYATATLFFIGMAVLVMRATACFRDTTASPSVTLPSEADAPLETGSLARATALLSLSEGWPDCRRGHRLIELCTFVTRRGGGVGLAEHGRFLADQAAERLHEGYSLVRTITWAVPILGFLGTVVGITMAIANVTPEQLDTSLSEVTDGLAVAFDTTALALTLSLLLVFASNATQRIEQSNLSEIESWSLREVAPLLAESEGVGGPLRDAEQQAARKMLAESEAAIRRQADLWEQSLEDLRQRWVDTLQRQTTDFETTLSKGLDQGLADHDRKLEMLRNEWLGACHQVTDGLVTQSDRFAKSLAGGVGDCVSAINRATDAVRDQLGQLQHQGELLLKVIEREEQLAGLEERLAENLEAVRTAEVFEQSLMSLTAAANLLSARAGTKAA